jgi:hypothetical protein
MDKILRIGNGAGFLGDSLDAPRRLVESAQLDYLTLEYLAELTLSILARTREKDPSQGYAGDFLDVLESLVPALREQPRLRIVTNAGGVNPTACARQAGRQLSEAGLGNVPIAVVMGDDLVGRLPELQAAGCEFRNLDTGQRLSELADSIVCANAYLGAEPIVRALQSQARIVITGRVADASLTVAPAMHELGGEWHDWDRLAAFSVAGHLIECGAQVTGGYSYACGLTGQGLADIGYPIADIASDGSCVITKPAGSGGVVNRQTVIEQLVYEIGDPRHYLTPDVDVDFTSVEVEEIGENRVAVRGATGNIAPESYKVSLAFHAGYQSSGQLLIYGRDAVAKAKQCGEIVRRRLKLAGFEYKAFHVECLGAGDAIPGRELSAPAGEIVLRITVQDPRREAVERFTKELAPLITSGPAGIAGYAAGRPQVRPVFAYWPTLVPKRFITPTVEVRTAAQWSQTP